jgi:hypothetical protein
VNLRGVVIHQVRRSFESQALSASALAFATASTSGRIFGRDYAKLIDDAMAACPEIRRADESRSMARHDGSMLVNLAQFMSANGMGRAR